MFLMAKKIKFALEMANGVQVRTIEELRDNFDQGKAMEYFVNGKLVEWLEDRYYDEEAEAISEIEENAPDAAVKICKALGVEYEDDGIELEDAINVAEKIAKLKKVTNDDAILKNAAYTAFDQEDLADLIDAGTKTIYLYGDVFSVPVKRLSDVKFVGILDSEPKIKLPSSCTKEMLGEKKIIFEDVLLPKDFQVNKVESLQAGKHDSYKDSVDKNEYDFRDVTAGDTIKFGKYQQNTSDKEPIEWLVLKVYDDSIWVVSKYALFQCEYHNRKGDITWEYANLRYVLNNSFYNSAFSKEEKKLIKKDYVSGGNNPDAFLANSGEGNDDSVFILDGCQVDNFSNDYERKCKATKYAKETGVKTKDDYCRWWVRGPGNTGFNDNLMNAMSMSWMFAHPDESASLEDDDGSTDLAMVIEYSGKLDTTGQKANTQGLGVRPSILIKI